MKDSSSLVGGAATIVALDGGDDCCFSLLNEQSLIVHFQMPTSRLVDLDQVAGETVGNLRKSLPEFELRVLGA